MCLCWFFLWKVWFIIVRVGVSRKVVFIFCRVCVVYRVGVVGVRV